MFSKSLVSAAITCAPVCSAGAQSYSEKAVCKLTNTEVDVAIFDGPCTVTQSESGNNAFLEVQMGAANPSCLPASKVN